MIKKISKTLLIIFIVLQFIFLSLIFSINNNSKKESVLKTITTHAEEIEVKFKPQVTIPDSIFEKTEKIYLKDHPNLIGEYIVAYYIYAQKIAGILAAVVIAIAGVIWLTAGGNTSKIETAKGYIAGALSGLVLVFLSYILLYQINPALTTMHLNSIDAVTPGKDISNATETEIKTMLEKCDKECGEKAYQMDKNGNCNCENSGTHSECQMEYTVGGKQQYKCVSVPYKGVSTCTNDQSCQQKLGCCQCVWETGGVALSTTCTSGLGFGSVEDCHKHCGFWPSAYFTPSAMCNSNDECIKQ